MRNRKSGYGCPEGCPVEATLDVIGGKWKGVILYHLLDGKKRFNELRRFIPGITQRMLSLQLSELEQDGVISRTVFPEVPPRVEYAMTEFGTTLEPIITQMKKWGDQYKANMLEKKQKRQ
ncbi:ArsR family transcriptional regulator [Virgibacillus dokdonensis]|uniref:DNA-binding transcriptional regulator, HxlR family n=2 Tax=Virgibacillus TaxID=84406 RepID=A0A1M5RHK8_9BACI|nr:MULTISPECIES: helix-turn-helix domain-containing protein [Virgibacillus]RFA34329.1 ArsR family transcriptional regulator [Virgibacillus dokdonensis]SHH25721.1 DNA-binding transcriptional regulator, HxlR family [Virgibacillus chiguensis]